MMIAGIQPLSLIDYPGKPCSVIFTQGCVFRCSYCHNPDLIPLEAQAPPRGVSDILSYLDERKEIVDAVCITGGEPTLQKGLIDFMMTLKTLGFFVKLDTNGINPTVVEKLIASLLIDYVAMDLKAPWEKYLDVIRAGTAATIEACKSTLSLIQDSGVPHEFRTTILPGVHAREDFFEMAGYLHPGEQYFIQKTSFKKTLEPLIPSTLDADEITRDIQNAFGNLIVACR